MEEDNSLLRRTKKVLNKQFNIKINGQVFQIVNYWVKPFQSAESTGQYLRLIGKKAIPYLSGQDNIIEITDDGTTRVFTCRFDHGVTGTGPSKEAVFIILKED